MVDLGKTTKRVLLSLGAVTLLGAGFATHYHTRPPTAQYEGNRIVSITRPAFPFQKETFEWGEEADALHIERLLYDDAVSYQDTHLKLTVEGTGMNIIQPKDNLVDVIVNYSSGEMAGVQMNPFAENETPEFTDATAIFQERRDYFEQEKRKLESKL